MFVKSVSDDMLNIAKMFEPEAVTFLSYNNKARTPLGLAAATLQAPILMHLEYKIKLPDHSFVVTPARQLIPSVYGVCEITPKEELSYSRNILLRIRNSEHDTSDVFTHAHDLIKLFKSRDILQKQILLMETVGAQDEAPLSWTNAYNSVSI